MEHFILFAVALTAIAFLSVLLARPLSSNDMEEGLIQETDAPAAPGKMNYIPVPVHRRFPAQVATPAHGMQTDSPAVYSANLTNLNELVHEKNWI